MTQVVSHPPTESDARIGPSKIRRLYDDGVKAIEKETQRYWENVAFLQGEQWVYWAKTRNRLEELPRDETRVRATVNRLGASVRRLLAKALKRPIIFEVPPTAADDATIQGARIAESVLSDLSREQNWEAFREQTTLACLQGGTGLVCLDWDPEAGVELERDAEDRVLGTGEIVLTPLSITEAVTEPGTRDIETAQWWIKALALPAEEVKVAYNLAEAPAADASTALSPVQQKLLQTDRSSKPIDLVLVLTYYERPSPKNKKGQCAVVVGNEIVDGPYPWPFPFEDRLNVACARETKVLHRWTGDTVISAGVPVQTLYNQIWSCLAEHTKLAANLRVLWPMGSGDAVDSLSDLPGEIVEYMPVGGIKPEWWNPGQLPAWLIQQPEMLAKEMDDLLGLPDVVRGEAPRNIESGSGLSILSEAAETPIAKLAVEVANAYARIGSLVLETYEAKVTEERTARVDYPHQVSQTVTWTGQDLCGQTRVIVPDNAVLPISAAEVWTKGVNLWDRGFFRRPDGTMDYRAFAQFISSSGEDNFVEATDPDVGKAQRENYQMANGEPMLPAAFDDHGKHIEIHNAYRKSASYERLDEATRGMIDQHVQAHETLGAEDAAQAANRQMQDIGTGHLSLAPSASRGMIGPPGPTSQPGSPADQSLALSQVGQS